MGHGTRQIQRICVLDFSLTYFDDPHRLEKFCLPKRPSKTAKQGLVWEQGLFSSPSCKSCTQAHTGGTAGRFGFAGS